MLLSQSLLSATSLKLSLSRIIFGFPRVFEIAEVCCIMQQVENISFAALVGVIYDTALDSQRKQVHYIITGSVHRPPVFSQDRRARERTNPGVFTRANARDGGGGGVIETMVHSFSIHKNSEA